MTKLKNTKKGMAKKAMSISLVAAMLATSNVPVWATEFGDGSDVVAFTDDAVEAVEEVVEETAPAVEEVEDVPVVTAVGDAWTVKLTNMPKEVEWGSSETIAVEVKDVDGNVVTTKSGLKYVWKNTSDNLAIAASANVTESIATPKTTAANIGNSYVLYIYDENGDWEYTSDAVTVSAQDVSTKGYSITAGNRYYTGKTTTLDAKVTGAGDIAFDIDYSGDLVNAGTVKVTATPKDTKLYKGVVEGSFEIQKVALSDYVSNITATMSTKQFTYTGNAIDVKKADINVIDKNTGVSLAELIADDAAVVSTATTVGTDNTATVTLTANSDTKNFTGTTTVTTDKFAVVARDLSTVTVTITSQPKNGTTKPVLTEKDVTFKAADGTKLNLFGAVDITVPDTAINFGSYTVTLKAKSVTAPNVANVTGQTTATLSIYTNDISQAELSQTGKTYAEATEQYTGSQITKDTTKLDLANMTINGNKVDPADYRIEFGENVKAGKGYIYIIGQRTYEGSRKEIEFSIEQATLSEVKAADYVEINESATKASDYASAVNLVVKAKNTATPAKEFTLVEGTDYTVKYSYKNENKVDNKLIAEITLTPGGNFKDAAPSKRTVEIDIVKPSLSNANIQLKKTSYEYTGAIIVPEFDVVFGGKTLVKDKDYKVVSVTNSAEVGTATLTIEGIGEYSQKASANFTITQASAEKVEVAVTGTYTYDGTQKKPETYTVKLNGNDVTSQFDVTYGENINAGKEAGTVVVTPKKDNKNFVAGTSKTGTFEIEQAELTGTIKVYNAKGLDITESLPTFDYDGTAKTFDKVVFTPSVKTTVTENDYEIQYVNNVTGNGEKGASIVVIAKGNYKATNKVVDKSTGKDVDIKNVAVEKNFTINSKLYFTEKEVTVTDAEYAEGVAVKPTIVVTDGNKTLVEGTDYTVTLNPVNGASEPGSTEYTWTVTGKGVYGTISAGKNQATGTWKVTKKDVANLDITVDLDKDGNAVATVMNGNIKVDNKNFDITLSEDKKTATVVATTGNKYYINSKEVTVNGAEEKTVEAPVISNVKVVGNTITVVLSGECDGATGYDYVISTENNYTDGRLTNGINKNILATETSYNYVDQGIYYAYCHAWTRDENGKKVFSEWSNIYPFSVSAITPEQPTISSVKVSGSTVTVTYTASENATGYDVVLGSAVKKVNGESRPVSYGTLVKKVTNGNTVTATFKNVPAGTYYAGLHAYNRTSADGKKVFSAWSNTKKVTVK